MFTVTIPGKPKAMDRPRVAISGFRPSGGKVRNIRWDPDKPPGKIGAHVYTPKGTLDYERLVAEMAVGQGVRRIEGPVGVEVRFYMYAPSKKTAGDTDNLLKTLFDGLNGVAFDDDSQIEYVKAEKFYVESKTEQKTVARIGRLDEFEGAPD